MGYTRRERLFRVELPLAVPLIIAGIRLATVTTIGLATVAAVLGDAVRRARPADHRGDPDLLPDQVPARRGPVGPPRLRGRLPARPAREGHDAVGARPGAERPDGRRRRVLPRPGQLDRAPGHPEPALGASRDLRPGGRSRRSLIAIPIGLYVGHTNNGSGIAINTANIGRAIPSYAMMVIPLPLTLTLAPILGYSANFGLTSPADVPRDDVPRDPAAPRLDLRRAALGRSRPLEAGRGMGLRERQILDRLELPLASLDHRRRPPDGDPPGDRDRDDRRRSSAAAGSAGSSSTG